jgi:leucyl-tRNA synthetase
MESSETRSASQAAFYDFEEQLRWYRRRTDTDRPAARWTLRAVLETRLRLLAPFVPFMTNELHERLTGTPAEDASWPEPDDSLESAAVEARESQIERLTEDILGIQRSLANADEDVPEADPDRIVVTVAADWKREVFDAVAEEGGDQGAVMGTVMQNPDLRERGNEVNDLVGELVEFARGRDDDEVAALASLDEYETYEAATAFLSREFDADVEIRLEGDDAEATKQAIPLRPAVELEVE